MTRPPSGHIVTRDFDNPAFEPFQGRVGFSVDELFAQDVLLTVPAGKRLVIEYMNRRAELPIGQTIIHVRMQIVEAGGNGSIEHCFGAEFQGTQGGQDHFTFNHLMRVYAAPGSSITVIVNRSATDAFGTASVAVTGYFVDIV
jgi:hypothetical protein